MEKIYANNMPILRYWHLKWKILYKILFSLFKFCIPIDIINEAQHNHPHLLSLYFYQPQSSSISQWLEGIQSSGIC